MKQLRAWHTIECAKTTNIKPKDYLDFLAGDKADGLGATIFLSAFFFFFSFFFGLLSPMATPPVRYIEYTLLPRLCHFFQRNQASRSRL